MWSSYEAYEYAGYSEDSDSRFVRNVAFCLLYYMASHPRRQYSNKLKFICIEDSNRTQQLYCNIWTWLQQPWIIRVRSKFHIIFGYSLLGPLQERERFHFWCPLQSTERPLYAEEVSVRLSVMLIQTESGLQKAIYGLIDVSREPFHRYCLNLVRETFIQRCWIIPITRHWSTIINWPFDVSHKPFTQILLKFGMTLSLNVVG
jgi:hypothetical protein